MTIQQTELMSGVTLTGIRTDQFKSSYFSVRVLTPLCEETAALNAVLPFVLRRGTARFPDMTALSAQLDEMYGGVIAPAVRKCGDMQCIGFDATFLDDAYVPDGTVILERATTLLGELLLDPATKNGRLRQEYVLSERDNLVRLIQSVRNDKRQYVMERLVEEMYAGDAYAIGRLGTLACAEKITPKKLYAQYRELLSNAQIELFYCGSMSMERVTMAWKSALMGLPRARTYYETETNHRYFPTQAERVFTEAMDVSQCKLQIGFQTGIAMTDPLYPPMLVFNAMFGSSTNSRLFLHVREKRSLCYYASSSMDSLKGLIMASCGVDASKLQEAKCEILAQLGALQAGDFTAQELDAAKKSVLNALRSAADEQSSLCSLWLRDRAAGLRFDLQLLIDRVSEVTSGEVVAAAMQVRLNSSFCLMPAEGNTEVTENEGA